MTGAALVRPFAGIGIDDRPVVGGKGASLGELAAAGIAVPPGCVVTTAAFDQAMAAVDPDGAKRGGIAKLAPDDHAAIAEGTRGLREQIVTVALPGDVTRTITDHYRDLAGPSATAPGATPVAVRSSATSEDAADASFAGLQDTYLWIRGARAVLDHVRRCWASLYSVESVAYRRRLGMPEEGLAMAVVIQHMVDAEISGVMFTCSPATGDRSVVALESAWGLGSAVVSGEVSPDHHVINKVTGDIIERTVATKLRRHRMDPSGAGVLAEDVPADLQSRPCLDDDQIRALVRIAREIERHYGAPQDIEWALSPNGDVYVLQSRPETAWSGRPPAPVARPRQRAFDHVIDLLGGGAAPGGRDS